MPPVPGEPPLPTVLAAVLAAVVPDSSPPQPIKPPKLSSNAPRIHFSLFDIDRIHSHGESIVPMKALYGSFES
jgi:hypothetical protein